MTSCLVSLAALGPSCLYESSPDPGRVPTVPQATRTARTQPLPSPRSPSCSIAQIRDTSVPESLPTVPSPAKKVALPPSGGPGLRPQTRSPLLSLSLHIQSISKPRGLGQNPTRLRPLPSLGPSSCPPPCLRLSCSHWRNPVRAAVSSCPHPAQSCPVAPTSL